MNEQNTFLLHYPLVNSDFVNSDCADPSEYGNSLSFRTTSLK